jgi:hypothetical protein
MGIVMKYCNQTYEVRVPSGEGDRVCSLHFLAHEVNTPSDGDKLALSSSQVDKIQLQCVRSKLHLQK